MHKQNPLRTAKGLTTVAVLSAIAAVLFMIEIPVVLFYKLDFSNLPVLLGTFALGPLAGALVLLLKAALGLLHSSSLGVGELADFLMGLAMLLPAGLIYRARRTRGAALVGMLAGTVCAAAAGVLTNVYLLIPFYGTAFGMPVEQIVAMGQTLVPAIQTEWEFVLCITAPFNLLKFALISLVTYLIYKPLSPLLHGSRPGLAPERKL